MARIHNSLNIPINFFLTDHCNLNCKYCQTHSPIADKKFLDINRFEQDLKRLVYLSNGAISQINLLGGEPLLHPDWASFIYIARKYLPNAKILFITNGILIKKFFETFFNILSRNNITLNITKYPIGLNLDLIEEKAKLSNISIEYSYADNNWMKYNYVTKPFAKWKSKALFLNCYQIHTCHALVDGKYYPCSIASRFDILKNKTGEIFPNMDNGIDIYNVSSLEEILDFISVPPPVCAYCNLPRWTSTNWERSTKDPHEWIDS